MSNQVRIDKEIVRLAQKRVGKTGTPLAPELARIVVEETVVASDLESGLILESNAYSEDDSLVQALAVNDVVVNGAHVDVRVLGSDGRVSVARALVGTSYLANGSLVVRLDDGDGGEIVSHISETQWSEASGDDDSVSLPADTSAGFSLGSALRSLRSAPEHESVRLPDGGELTRFVAARKEIAGQRQRELVEVLFARQDARAKLADALSIWSAGTLQRILSSASLWNARVERLVDKLAPKFALIKRAEIKDVVMRVGEEHGGQPEAPQFKRAVVVGLARAEMVKRLQGADVARALAVVDKVLAGRSVATAVGDFVKNKVALDIARTIKDGRRGVEGFMAATADEIGMAFQQMALQPAYATHSHDEQAGVDSINEALELLEAGDVAERIAQIEQEI